MNREPNGGGPLPHRRNHRRSFGLCCWTVSQWAVFATIVMVMPPEPGNVHRVFWEEHSTKYVRFAMSALPRVQCAATYPLLAQWSADGRRIYPKARPVPLR